MSIFLKYIFPNFQLGGSLESKAENKVMYRNNVKTKRSLIAHYMKELYYSKFLKTSLFGDYIILH